MLRLRLLLQLIGFINEELSSGVGFPREAQPLLLFWCRWPQAFFLTMR